ncbi:hypothetical protein BH11PSE4_BH11PSE4_14650 [soil metagenome]
MIRARVVPVSNVIQFPTRTELHSDDGEIDLLSAVDLAIRDLREIAQIASASAQIRARECLSMLEGAYAVATER